MKPLCLADLPEPSRYPALRAALRSAVIAHKQRRRVAVGDRVSVVFEDRETLRWQILEMIRVERIRDPRLIQQEIDVYNELLPGPHELSATLFIEITDLAKIRPELDRLIGIDEHVLLEIGERAERETVRAGFDEKQLEEDRISAVQYIRFALTPDQAARFQDPACPAALAIDHPAYAARTPLVGETRTSLARDLAGGAPSLIDFESLAEQPSAPGPLAESPRVEAFRRSPDRIDLEPRLPVEEIANADPSLLAEVTQLAARIAGELRAHHDESWELTLDLDARPLRWHLALKIGDVP